MVHELGSLTPAQLGDRVRQLQNLAYQLGLEEGKLIHPRRTGEQLLPILARKRLRWGFNIKPHRIVESRLKSNIAWTLRPKLQ